MQHTFKSLALTTAVATLLTACGGGGGSTTTAPVAVTPPVTPAVAAATLVTSVPAATYAGEQAAAFNLLNAERSQCGFGLLAQNAQLDTAAAGHANYLGVNNTSGHIQVAGQPGFTGVTIADRAANAGYKVGDVSEIAAARIAGSVSGIRGLLVAPYHLAAAMRGYRDVGIGYSALSTNSLVVNFGYASGGSLQLMSGTDIQTYPCNGSVGASRQLQYETPNPVPGRDLVANPIGTPILVAARVGNTLAITSATMIKVSTGASVQMRPAMGMSNDPNKVNGVSYFMSNEAYVAPEAALDPNSQYQVTVTGTNNGASFSRTFTFTTGTN